LGFHGLAGSPPGTHSWLRAVIFLRAIGQIEQIVQLSGLASPAGQDCHQALLHAPATSVNSMQATPVCSMTPQPTSCYLPLAYLQWPNRSSTI